VLDIPKLALRRQLRAIDQFAPEQPGDPIHGWDFLLEVAEDHVDIRADEVKTSSITAFPTFVSLSSLRVQLRVRRRDAGQAREQASKHQRPWHADSSHGARLR
jgi:hypothetical protein